jgi:hypothetical protein
MPAYTHLRTFIEAVKTGRTHITERLDDFFADLPAAREHPHWGDFVNGNWTGGAPEWLGGFLDEIELTTAERDHVLRYPAAELERVRAAAANAASDGISPTFRWGLYEGNEPRVITMEQGRIVLESPGGSLRLTRVNYGEVYVEDV